MIVGSSARTYKASRTKMKNETTTMTSGIRNRVPVAHNHDLLFSILTSSIIDPRFNN